MYKIVKLGDICKIINGSTPLRREKKYWLNGKVPWFTIDDLRAQGKNILKTFQKVTEAAVKDKKVRLVPANSVLLCCTASVGEVAISRIELATNQQFNALIPKSKNINSDYLYYVATTLTQKLLSVSGNATINFISLSKLKDINIVLPSIKDQTDITHRLDKTFAEIDNNIKLTKLKIEKIKKFNFFILSAMLKSRDFNRMKFSEVAEYVKENAQNSKLPYLGMENISSDTMKMIGEITIPNSTSTTFKFDERYVLFGRLRPYLRKVFLPNFKGQCSTEIFCIKPNKIVLREYIAYWLLEPSVSKKIELSSTGARMPRANMNSLLDFTIEIPSIKAQQKIVTNLKNAFQETDVVINALNKCLLNFQELKSSILEKELKMKVAA